MKRKMHILNLMIIVLLSPVFANAQDYLSFPTDSAVWYTVKSWPEYDPPPLYWYETYKFETKGDTIINSIEYIKLYSKYVLGTGTAHYDGAYRVDVQNERVYFIDDWDNTEALLYDFSLVPGDTIVITGSKYEPYNLICLDTSTMIINNTPHHTYSIYSYLSNGAECYTTWVKGIGSLRMPIETDMFCAAWFEGRFDLSCFYYKNEHIYEWQENPYFEGCIGSNVGIEETVDKNIFAIAPNPVTSTSRLISNTSGKYIFDYRIYNINGNMLQSGVNVEPADIIIQNSHFKRGIYVIRLFAQKDGHLYLIKFIIK